MPGFTIYDDQDQLQVIKTACGSWIWTTGNSIPGQCDRISNAKNRLEPGGMRQAVDYFMRRAADIYALYQQSWRLAMPWILTTCCSKPWSSLANHPDVLATISGSLKYILVDEYQDTNHVRCRLIQLLGQAPRNVCVVGDDDQSIYLFRGADVRNILDFEQDYPDARIIKLEQNYPFHRQHPGRRQLGDCPQPAAQRPRRCGRRRGGLPGQPVYRPKSRPMEAALWCGRCRPGSPPGGLRRALSHLAQSRALEDAMLRAGIPYQLIGSQPFYGRKGNQGHACLPAVAGQPRDTVAA